MPLLLYKHPVYVQRFVLMSFDQVKALRLQQWRSTLDDHDFRMQNPEAHRETLHSMAATLATEWLVDQLQHST